MKSKYTLFASAICNPYLTLTCNAKMAFKMKDNFSRWLTIKKKACSKGS